MTHKIKQIKRSIEKSLKNAGIYSPHLDIQLESLASAVLTLRMANDDIEALDSVMTIEKSKYGEKPVMHPAFKVQRDAMAEVSKQMKQLNLTVADLVGNPEKPGPIDDLTDILASIK